MRSGASDAAGPKCWEQVGEDRTPIDTAPTYRKAISVVVDPDAAEVVQQLHGGLFWRLSPVADSGVAVGLADVVGAGFVVEAPLHCGHQARFHEFVAGQHRRDGLSGADLLGGGSSAHHVIQLGLDLVPVPGNRGNARDGEVADGCSLAVVKAPTR